MNYSLAVLLASDEVKLINVQFNYANSASKQYTYKCCLNVEKGDYVIVESGQWYNIARVVDTNVAPNMNDDILYKWAFAKVDMSTLDNLRTQENEAIKTIRKAELQSTRRQLAKELGISADDVKGITFTQNNVEAKASTDDSTENKGEW